KKNDNDPVTKFIGCSKWNPHEKHIFHILNKNQINIDLLEKLFQGKEKLNNQILQTCKTVLSTSSRLQNCKFYHPGENNTIGCHGKIIHLQCQ
ncbi:11548_t:CDS:2, partial [Racocetra persica]